MIPKSNYYEICLISHTFWIKSSELEIGQTLENQTFSHSSQFVVSDKLMPSMTDGKPRRHYFEEQKKKLVMLKTVNTLASKKVVMIYKLLEIFSISVEL